MFSLQVKLACTASQKPKPEHVNKNAGSPRSAVLPGRIDCVYFLMWPGWKEELRSNRWHYANGGATSHRSCWFNRTCPLMTVARGLPSPNHVFRIAVYCRRVARQRFSTDGP